MILLALAVLTADPATLNTVLAEVRAGDTVVLGAGRYGR